VARRRPFLSHAPCADSIDRLNRSLGLPLRLGALGMPQEMLPRMAELAVADHSTATNPRPAGKADFLALLEEAY
jgi:4-hydroxybutyrate dehydrogenase